MKPSLARKRVSGKAADEHLEMRAVQCLRRLSSGVASSAMIITLAFGLASVPLVRFGSRTCCAFAWPVPVVHRAVPIASFHTIETWRHNRAYCDMRKVERQAYKHDAGLPSAYVLQFFQV